MEKAQRRLFGDNLVRDSCGNLTINIDFASDNEEERWLYEDCMVGIEQTLPSGVYSSIDDINDSGCVNLIHTVFKTAVNIELPAKKSEPIVIHLLSKVRDYRTDIYIPVHARYHNPAKGGGMVRNEIPVPKVYLLCPDSRLERCDDLYAELTHPNNFCSEHVSKENCTWKEIPIIMVTAPLSWHVPVGDTEHYALVAGGTALVIALGSLYLLNTLRRYHSLAHRNNKKIS
ncbi:phosphatidylinositol-glycan biosynthesis class X protein isoform X2 [Bicyclus anynana]|uniref:Phosphatidylinositol-glycan biosynthesis class X protein n=1 Tax=Bicyclus anynana TaxID=110368 RepID=A0A6J1P7V6_BICAN|nr:phosphatidylinositol-glycan biosynthesis class X protein isoform X2 [Bicyclus anynana]